MMRLPLVADGSSTPSLRQAKLNGPVPWAAVTSETKSPRHTIMFVSDVAVVSWLTINEAVLVTELHTPVTSTEYTPA